MFMEGIVQGALNIKLCSVCRGTSYCWDNVSL